MQHNLGRWGNDTAASVEKRLALLVAALLWDCEDLHDDVYECHAAEGEGPSPNLRFVELTEDGRVEVLADGQEYVLRVEPKYR